MCPNRLIPWLQKRLARAQFGRHGRKSRVNRGSTLTGAPGFMFRSTHAPGVAAEPTLRPAQILPVFYRFADYNLHLTVQKLHLAHVVRTRRRARVMAGDD